MNLIILLTYHKRKALCHVISHLVDYDVNTIVSHLDMQAQSHFGKAFLREQSFCFANAFSFSEIFL